MPRPAVGDEWELRFLKNPAAKGWEDLCRQYPEAAARAHDELRVNPRARNDRNHPLKGALATGAAHGQILERWQHEVTGAGRIWFLIDDERRVLWFEQATVGHPKATE